jgi:hypothetical protein
VSGLFEVLLLKGFGVPGMEPTETPDEKLRPPFDRAREVSRFCLPAPFSVLLHTLIDCLGGNFRYFEKKESFFCVSEKNTLSGGFYSDAFPGESRVKMYACNTFEA